MKAFKKNKKTSQKIFVVTLLALPLLHFLIFFVYINIDTIVLSLQKFDYNLGEYRFVGLNNYKSLIRDLTSVKQLKQSVINSLLFFPITNFITLPLSIFAAYFMFRKVPGRKIFQVLFFLPSIISIVVLTMNFQFMFDPIFGPINNLLKSIGIEPVGGWFGNKSTVMPMIFIYCIWAGVGFNVILLNGAISRIPSEVIEQGRLDGISMTREMFSVVIPMIWPTITTLFVVGTTSVFTIFLQNMLLSNGGPSGHSKTISFIITELVQTGDLTRAAALGTIFSIIGIPVIFGIKKIMEKIGPSTEY